MGPLKGRRSARTGGKRYELTWKEKIWIFSLPSQSGCISDGDDSINIWKIYVLGPNHEKRFCAWAWQELGKRFTSDGLDICVCVYISWITSISKSVMIDWKQRPLYPVLRIGCSLWDYWITPKRGRVSLNVSEIQFINADSCGAWCLSCTDLQQSKVTFLTSEYQAHWYLLDIYQYNLATVVWFYYSLYSQT